MTTPPSIVVTSAGAAPTLRRRAEELARQLGLAVARPGPVDPAAFRLCVRDDRLELIAPDDTGEHGTWVDFTRLDLRPSSRSLSRHQPLVRAVGARARTIADATAGLGYDAALLAALGYEVTAIERNPVIAALLADGVRRACADVGLRQALGGRLSTVVGDARAHLERMQPPPDVVYIDPMFPPKRKRSALPPKRVRIIRALVGADLDAVELLEVGRRVALQRAVLKRPTHIEPLAAVPVASHGGKLVRYDVYLPARE